MKRYVTLTASGISTVILIGITLTINKIHVGRSYGFFFIIIFFKYILRTYGPNGFNLLPRSTVNQF